MEIQKDSENTTKPYLEDALEHTEPPFWMVVADKLDQKNKELIKQRDSAEEKSKIAELENRTDKLTGLPNLNYFDKTIIEAYSDPQNAECYLGEVAIIYYDLDDLKFVNETYGHHAGNELLKTAAEFLKLNAKEGYTAIRLHGDEFVLVCPNVSGDPDFAKKIKIEFDELKQKANEVELSFYNEKTGNYDTMRLSISGGMDIYNGRNQGSDIKKTVITAERQMKVEKDASKAKRIIDLLNIHKSPK